VKGEFKVGDYVYMVFTPVKCGRVVRVIPGKPYERWPDECEPSTLHVKTLKGDILTGSELSFNNYRTLIEDHRRKLAKHEAILAKLEAL